MKIERTERGFRIFGRVDAHCGATVRVQESSLAGKGAHVCLFCDGDLRLNVAQAKALRDALDTFVREAEAGQLAEPAAIGET